MDLSSKSGPFVKDLNFCRKCRSFVKKWELLKHPLHPPLFPGYGPGLDKKKSGYSIASLTEKENWIEEKLVIKKFTKMTKVVSVGFIYSLKKKNLIFAG